MAYSLNKNVLKTVNQMIEKKDELKIRIEKASTGTTIVDTGIDAEGSYAAGRLVIEACMGSFGEASLTIMTLEDLCLPAVSVVTDLPAIALLGSQFAGWRVKIGKYFAMGSGPARALAVKPKELYAKIDYQDKADSATIILETSMKPSQEVITYLANECKVDLEKLYIIVTPTASISGLTQISGRIIETGMHKLTEVGLDPKVVLSGIGYAPIATVHPNQTKAMGRANDMILYGGSAFFNIAFEDDEKLGNIVKQVPSSTSDDYGKPFAQIFEGAGCDFYKIDSRLFAPAVIGVNNVKTGRYFQAGKINTEVLKQSVSS